ncbi:hypothetical protein TR75_02715 [Hydrogenibacillus schlegelii]|nr:hypothetical protein TR75_02715 [Hydrogenibacillus schlegelii]
MDRRPKRGAKRREKRSPGRVHPAAVVLKAGASSVSGAYASYAGHLLAVGAARGRSIAFAGRRASPLDEGRKSEKGAKSSGRAVRRKERLRSTAAGAF